MTYDSIPSYYGLGTQYTTVPFVPSASLDMSYPALFNFGGFASSSDSNTDTLSIEEQNKRIDKENKEKAKKRANECVQKWKDKDLGSDERKTMQKFLLDHNVEPTAGAMALAVPAVAGGHAMAKKAPDPVLYNFFDKKSLEAHNLYKTHPDLMTEAQAVMREYEKSCERDLKRVAGDDALTKQIQKERSLMRKEMYNAVRNGEVDKIAEMTEKLKVGNDVKNGWFNRTTRKWRGKDAVVSRSGAIVEAESAGKIKVKPPKAGTSFWRNLGGKMSWKMGGLFVAGCLIADAGKIQEAYATDTSTGNKQLLHSGGKAALSTGAYMAADAAGKTVAKKCLGKIATKVATKIAVKGGCKLLGTAIGSIVPGVGTAIGLVVGTVADILLDVFVFSKKKDPVVESQVQNANNDELLQASVQQYMQNGNLEPPKEVWDVWNRKFDQDTIAEMKRVNKLDDKAKQEYFAQLQQEQQSAAQEQAAAA